MNLEIFVVVLDCFHLLQEGFGLVFESFEVFEVILLVTDQELLLNVSWKLVFLFLSTSSWVFGLSYLSSWKADQVLMVFNINMPILLIFP